MTDSRQELSPVAEMVAIQLGHSRPQPTDRLIEDLGAESADLVNLAGAIDDRFGVFIGEEDLATIRTVADLEELVGQRQK
jgi:acyl carrier protein